MRIAVAADERTGIADAVVHELRRRGHDPVLHGALAEDDRDDWAWCAEAAARDVVEGRAEQAVVCCWTGTGASIAANKVPGIRAALCGDAPTAAGARTWNDANVLALSLRATSAAELEEILDAWFQGAPSTDADDAANIAHLGEIELESRAPVTVLIDGRAAVRPELGGVERWARELCARLPALRPDRYVVARPPAALAHRAGHAWEQAVLPIRGRSAALVLGPANLAPVVFPRNVVVIHDAAVLREPGWYAPIYARWHGALLPRLARGARRVITVSEFSARELRDLVGVEAAVVPGGVDERFAPSADPGPARAALGLDRPYVLTVASRIARKNLGALGVAAARLAAGGIDLVAAGGERPQFRGPSAPGPRDLGPVPDAHLPGLYAGARAFVLPSLYEGFGLPCVEAMACGAPVVAAAAAALPETCGDAALYADPRDPGAIADAVERALEPPTAERLRAAGLRRAAPFTWDRTVRGVDAVFDDLLAPR